MPRAEGSAESDVPLGPAAYSLSWNGLRCFSTKTRFSRKGPALGADSSRAWFRPVRSFPGEEHILLHPPFEEQRRHTRGSLPAVLEQPAPHLSDLRVVPLLCRVGTCAVPRTPPRASAGRATHNAARIGMTCRAARTAACVGRTCRQQSWAQNAVGVLAKAAPSPHLVAPGEGSAHVHVAVVWLFCRLEKCRTKIIQN